jgi:hypothetical protein
MCKLPISVVIVGVGSADFANMEILDADDNPLRSSAGEKASRDIVQFVPFRKFKDDPVRLAKETLAEIPGQLVGFMAANRIPPGTSGRGIHATYDAPLPRATSVVVSTTSTSTVAGPVPMAQPAPMGSMNMQSYPVGAQPVQQQPQPYPAQIQGGYTMPQSQQQPMQQQYAPQPGQQLPTAQPGLIRNQSYQIPPPQQSQGYPQQTPAFAPAVQQQQQMPQQSWYGQPPGQAQPQQQQSWYGQPQGPAPGYWEMKATFE